MLKSTTEIRVRYSETDQIGRVYYANFLVYFEVARTQLIRNHWKPYSELEKDGYLLPVMNAGCKYFLPVGYDDLVRIETCLTLPRPSLLRFDYTIDNPRCLTLVAEGFTEHCFVGRDGKLRRVPRELVRLIKESTGEPNQ